VHGFWAFKCHKLAPNRVQNGWKAYLIKVLPLFGKPYDIYGSFMNFCRKQLGLRDGQDKFLPFPYNWLDDNRNTAEKLADFIRNQDHSSRLFLIAHSMGSIVCQLMLSDRVSLITIIVRLFGWVLVPLSIRLLIPLLPRSNRLQKRLNRRMGQQKAVLSLHQPQVRNRTQRDRFGEVAFWGLLRFHLFREDKEVSAERLILTNKLRMNPKKFTSFILDSF